MLDLDATDDPLHGHQKGRFFHGFYDCHCYLPLYVFCGRHLLAAKLRRSNIDASAGAVEEVARIVARIHERWPRVKFILRADSGFAREALMSWCKYEAQTLYEQLYCARGQMENRIKECQLDVFEPPLVSRRLLLVRKGLSWKSNGEAENFPTRFASGQCRH